MSNATPRTQLLTFLNLAFVLPALVVALAFVVIGGESQAVEPAPQTAVTEPGPTEKAEAMVADQEREATKGATCWTDPTGHDVSKAVVKIDGTSTVETITADEAWERAHAGEVWVLKWCA